MAFQHVVLHVGNTIIILLNFLLFILHICFPGTLHLEDHENDSDTK